MAAPQITLVGNLTRDPELKYAASGNAWGFFTIANTTWRKNKDTDAWEEAGTSFYDCKVFGDLMERITESFQKGDRIMVIGKMAQENWEKDGEKRSKMVCTVDEAAASVKSATVQIAKITREDTTNGGYQAPAAPAQNPDEEPFHVDAGEWSPMLGFGEYPSRLLP